MGHKKRTLEDVIALANSERPSDWIEAANNSLCPEGSLLALLDNLGLQEWGGNHSINSTALLIAVGANKNLSVESLRSLFDKYFKNGAPEKFPGWGGRVGVFCNPILTEELIRYFFKDIGGSDKYLLKHPNCPKDILEYFFFNGDDEDKRLIAWYGFLDRGLIMKIWATENKEPNARDSLRNFTLRNHNIQSTIFTDEELMTVTDYKALILRSFEARTNRSKEFCEKFATHIENLYKGSTVEAQSAVLNLTQDPVRLERYARTSSSNIIRYQVSQRKELTQETRVYAVLAGGTKSNYTKEYTEYEEDAFATVEPMKSKL
jgi:hypothetical protein